MQRSLEKGRIMSIREALSEINCARKYGVKSQGYRVGRANQLVTEN
jgi:hypothetical protein